MSHPRDASADPSSNSNAPKPANWTKRIIVALAVTGVIGTVLVVTLGVMAARFVGGAADKLQSMDMATIETRMAEAAMGLDQGQREIIGPLVEKLKKNELTLPQREEIEKAIMDALGPEQRKQIEALKNIENIGTRGLDGLVASVVAWLEERGVPVGLLTGNSEGSPQQR